MKRFQQVRGSSESIESISSEPTGRVVTDAKPVVKRVPSKYISSFHLSSILKRQFPHGGYEVDVSKMLWNIQNPTANRDLSHSSNKMSM